MLLPAPLTRLVKYCTRISILLVTLTHSLSNLCLLGAMPRLWEMRLRRSNISSFIEAITTSTIMQLAFLILPPSAATRLIEYLTNKASCTINSILGHTADQDLLLDGRPVENFIPLQDRGYGLSITIIEYKDSFQLAVLAPNSHGLCYKARAALRRICATHACAERAIDGTRARRPRSGTENFEQSTKQRVYCRRR